ncbi:MAG: sulfatase-like hydrolase/transferase [Candidatus Omnitrophica bacterium]|nr:sulfatase-like hydrolase/transferase [Candidatus Omnitrophota bacterium]
MIKDAMFSMSFANLCFLKLWINYLFLIDSQKYSIHVLPNASGYFALMTNVFIAASLIFIFIRLIRKSNNIFVQRTARFTFFVLILNILNVIRKTSTSFSLQTLLITVSLFLKKLNIWVCLVAVFLLIVLGILLYKKFSRLLFKMLTAGIIFLFPFVFFTFSGAIGAIVKCEKTKPVSPKDCILEVEPVGKQNHLRILWLVFDEIDQKIVFDQRPFGLSFPELDRFRSESFYATNAYPAGDETMVVFPALIDGKLVSKILPVANNKLEITYADTNQRFIWGTQPNIFSRIRNLGFNSAFVGWYHPYCNILGNNLDFCVQVHGEYFLVRNYDSLLENMKEQFIHLLPFAAIIEHIDAFEETMDNVKQIIGHPDYNLAMVHFPIPHLPSIYDQKEQKISLFVDQSNGYFSNLLLADKTLGEIRRMLEKSKLYDDITIIVTSDHYLRNSKIFNMKQDNRIPFMVKMAGQNNFVKYTKTFNTVLTGDLILSILRNETKTNNDIAAWIDKNRNEIRN